MTTPILDFSTLEPARPVIRIDGQDYTLALLSDFGLQAQSRIARLMAEGAALEREVDALPPPPSTGNPDADAALIALGAIPEAAAERTMALLDEVIDLILRAPADVRARLSEVQKRRIIEAFTPTVAAATPATKQGRKTRTARSTSGPSSPNSARPMATVPG